jgi:hypothetical protein
MILINFLYLCNKLKDMEQYLNDYLESQSFDPQNFDYLQQMTDDYQCKILMESLAEELNS